MSRKLRDAVYIAAPPLCLLMTVIAILVLKFGYNDTPSITDWLTGIFGILALFVSIWSVTLLTETLRAETEARRPWVDFASHTPLVEKQLGLTETGSRFNTSLIFKNFGISPALDCVIDMQVSKLGKSGAQVVKPLTYQAGDLPPMGEAHIDLSNVHCVLSQPQVIWVEIKYRRIDDPKWIELRQLALETTLSKGYLELRKVAFIRPNIAPE